MPAIISSLTSTFILVYIFANTSVTFAYDQLHGARGRIYNVNFEDGCFEILKSTAYDPKTKEGKSRFVVHWNQKTRFFLVEEKKDFSDIPGPVVTEFYYLDSKATEAIRGEQKFSARFANILPESNSANGLRDDGRLYSAWFTPDPNTRDSLSGTTLFEDINIKATLTNIRSGVFIKRSTTDRALSSGLFSTRIYGENQGSKFVLKKVELYPLEDPRLSDDPNLPRVLVIGDSISMNYHESAKESLEGKANYHRIEGNGGPSDRGVTNLDLWLGDYTQKGFEWDIILFNHGLHDLKQVYNLETNIWGHHQVSLAEYKINLQKEILKLKSTGAQLIWCSTTPVPNNRKGKFGRRKDEDLVFNKAALEVVQQHPDISILDLNRVVRDNRIFDSWRQGNDVHFLNEGEQKCLGKAVAQAISSRLLSN